MRTDWPNLVARDREGRFHELGEGWTWNRSDISEVPQELAGARERHAARRSARRRTLTPGQVTLERSENLLVKSLDRVALLAQPVAEVASGLDIGGCGRTSELLPFKKPGKPVEIPAGRASSISRDPDCG